MFWNEKSKRLFGQAGCVQLEQLCTACASAASVVKARTRRAVHTFIVWAGGLSTRSRCAALGLVALVGCAAVVPDQGMRSRSLRRSFDCSVTKESPAWCEARARARAMRDIP